MKIKIARKDLNTVNTCKIPIIVVPGIMASRLCLQNGQTFWDPDDDLKMIELSLTPANVKSVYMNAEFNLKVCQKGKPNKTKEWSNDAQIIKQNEERGWGGASWKYYGKLIASLANSMVEWRNTSKVYVFGYDWRQSNKDSGAGLFQYAQQVLVKEKAEKVIIVTHSMGGLVTRWACKSGLEDIVHGVVHITQPVAGAVVFYRRFKTGTKAGLVTKDIDGGGVGDLVFSDIVGETPQDFQRIAGGVKGAFELLPTNLHPKISYQNVIDPLGKKELIETHWLMPDKPLKERFSHLFSNIYDVYREETGQIGIFNFKKTSADYIQMLKERWEDALWIFPEKIRLALLDEEIKVDKTTGRLIKKSLNSAERFHNFLQNYAHPNTFVIAVRLHRTDTGTHLEKNGNIIKATPHFKPGDATVSFVSQTALKIPLEKEITFEKSGLPNHAEICDSDDIIKTTKECVKKIILEAS